MTNLFLHRLDKLNPGDLHSCPKPYFNMDGDIHDVLSQPVDSVVDSVIIGGGSLIPGKEKRIRVEQHFRFGAGGFVAGVESGGNRAVA